MFNLFLEGTAPQSNPVLTYVIMGVLVAAIIGLFVWQTISGKKKQKEAQAMVDSIKIGDRIKTIGGICGFLVEVRDSDNTIVIETGTDDKKSYIRLVKDAIYQSGPANPNTNATSQPVKEEIKEEVKEEVKVEEPVNEEPVEEVAPKSEEDSFKAE